ncbi:2-dehydro-3-deoxy-6-phosphogalactonate aldolase [Litorivicinus lipolyticus]|uniref:2-dehydro-3-deoxy-6-phosphogalactonate aldolase n=1 Tax=Litorivicinus lipolyticus TaxID=418701 RepID=A0A5Q2QCB4_9GAMM|nr:2-dehydro-3-deoxy-6-phosphogalactonate aldolase [Litorivicinus lipolyticus]QGG79932.1 2-dehydro-3-deoxy-6-phosphogalactonate aldolase [Litorivicinus lipolyticus]
MTREIIAILRGIKTDEVVAIGQALVDAGIHTIEIPMNSPRALDSIEALVATLGSQASVGAGTVLSPQTVNEVAAVGGTLIVSPDTNPDVIAATKAAGMRSYPGVFTATECFMALRHGADGLKLFPGSRLKPEGLAALNAVLPAGTKTYAVGGAEPSSFADWFAVGVTGFGIGSGLYKAGFTTDEVRSRAAVIVAAYDRAQSN